METAKDIKDRTYSQVTLNLTESDYLAIQGSHWFETLGIKIDTQGKADNGALICIIYSHGIGRNLFTQRLCYALIQTFRSKL